ncbi:hypothetical protein H1164_10320 [Thermoactinomyces daqus]|uniref:Lipoprotein n=2 Tax=Thermoactinomyces TaxID=2023 RepID=A0A7W1XAZ9_9BACL|nr:hypothetical protein [Thermoactinomyces daqus]MBA4543290.1 hypothetical protein [Thermoactinomyces daqus]
MKKPWGRLRLGVVAIIMLLMLAILVSGCSKETLLPKDESYMTQAEEKKVKEAVIDYIQKRYNKNFEVQQIDKDHLFGADYTIRGKIKDGKDTIIYVTGNPPNDFQDTYVPQLWTDELEPRITKYAKETMDFRLMKNIVYGDGTKKTTYTGEIPSVYDVLKNGGDKDFTLTLSIEIYDHHGQSQAEISKFLNELKKMNLNEVIIEIFVYDDKLKTISKKTDTDNYAIYRYNISGDIQKIDINNLDQYKTVIKH